MNNDEKKKTYAALSAPFGPEAIERTDGNVTGRGYSTTVGVGGYRTQQSISVRTSTSQKGRTVYEAGCDIVLQLGQWTDGVFVPFAEVHGTGGHTSMLEADAKKGAFTNGFKKAAAMLGCGKQAYEGTLDDDNAPVADEGGRAGPDVGDRRPSAADNDTNSSTQRNRLTSKQLAALWALARKLDIDKAAFRGRVKERFGCTVEFLDRRDASTIIGELSAKLGNGRAREIVAGEVA